ncbi:hypothetical protein Tco_0313616 [Tanacetum coccineum]
MLWEPLPKDLVGASTQRCGGSLYPKMLCEPLPKDVVGASTLRCRGCIMVNRGEIASEAKRSLDRSSEGSEEVFLRKAGNSPVKPEYS